MLLNKDKQFIWNQEYSSNAVEGENVLIQGDNNDILPALVPYYAGKIKCIYIDPPYNNGDSYHFYNDRDTTNNWLKKLKKVLTHFKSLLAKDGSIWISIDDKEMAYLKVEADKIFGRENFVSTIVWQQRKTRENRAVFSCNHEYILVYAKDFLSFKKHRNPIPVPEDFVDSKYHNPDNDPRGPWQSVSLSVQAGHAVPSQFYTITSPTGVRHDPPKGRCWVHNEEKMLQEIAAGNVWFGMDGSNTPRKKKFLKDAKIGLTPETLWSGDNYGTTDSAKKQLLSLFPHNENVFDTPKPEELIKQIIEIASNEGDYVLDCYLGSGTTLAVAHKLRRRYIGVEIGTQMTELVVNRLNQVVAGEQTGISTLVNWNGGGDFSFYNFEKDKSVESECNTRPIHYSQLNLFEVKEKYPETIVENESIELTDSFSSDGLDTTKSLLVSLVKADNMESFLDGSAKIYYTGKKFPSTVHLNHLYYFMPYIKGKGVRDLYLIKVARVGTRREGCPDNDPNDFRLVFEVEFVKQLFDDYKPIELEIWHTYTDTTLENILTKNK